MPAHGIAKTDIHKVKSSEEVSAWSSFDTSLTVSDPHVTGHDKAKRTRIDLKFHKFVVRVTESTPFQGFIMFMIFLNSLFMALETDYELKDKWKDVFLVVDESFLAIYTVEFILKLYAEPLQYWRSSYNIFDFLILSISLAQAIIEKFNIASVGPAFQAIRILRAVRTLRTLRTVHFVRGLQVLVTALVDTIRKSVLNIVILLLLLMFLFGIMGYYFFGYQEGGDKVNWGNLGSAMLTLFSYVTVDGWTDLQNILDEKGMTGSRIFTAVFIFIGHFIFTNVFIGVIIMNISEATESFKQAEKAEREAVLNHKKEFMIKRQHQEVKQMLERQRLFQYSDFHEMIREFQRTLRHDDLELLGDLSTNIIWMEMFLRSLDHLDNTTYRLQRLQFEAANCLAHNAEEHIRNKMKRRQTHALIDEHDVVVAAARLNVRNQLKNKHI